MYNWQHKNWPHFEYSLERVEDLLLEYSVETGRLAGVAETLSDKKKRQASIDLMVFEALKTSEIEGEYLRRSDLISSIRNNLGLNTKPKFVNDKRAEGVAELMIDVRQTFDEKLTQKTLFLWHKMLMKGNHLVSKGKWRTHKEPMQIVSGPMGYEKVYFEAPPSEGVPEEMKRFISWFNSTGPNGKNEIKKPVVRAAVAHLYFESIHPFEDGNGRIGRAIAEKALSQNAKAPVLLSLSKAIESDKKSYYKNLNEASFKIEISDWIFYFTDMVLKAQKDAINWIQFTIKKSQFFDRYQNEINDRQTKAINRMLDEGPEGFTGGMNAKKYVAITKTSKATATRDLQDLAAKGIFVSVGAGRSTRYELDLMA